MEILELKDAITKINSSVDRFNTRMEGTKERINGTQTIDITQSEQLKMVNRTSENFNTI